MLVYWQFSFWLWTKSNSVWFITKRKSVSAIIFIIIRKETENEVIGVHGRSLMRRQERGKHSLAEPPAKQPYTHRVHNSPEIWCPNILKPPSSLHQNPRIKDLQEDPRIPQHCMVLRDLRGASFGAPLYREESVSRRRMMETAVWLHTTTPP